MLVSVIIPNYNGEKYLKSCIDSVINQGSVVKEIIVVDDNSIDNSWSILKIYERDFDYIKIFKNPKKGAQSARNYGFEQSTGEYIQWLDSDDILSKDKIIKQLAILKSENFNVVSFCGWVYFNKDINDVIIRPNIVWKDYQDPIQWLIDSWRGGGMMQTACWLTPRNICKEIVWDEKILKNQDGVYFFNVLLKANKLMFEPNTLVYYRQPSNINISQRKDEEALSSLLDTYKHYEKLLEISDTKRVREALASNYANFIYYTYPQLRKLRKRAYIEIKKLALPRIPLIGGAKFQFLQKLLGFKAAVTVRYYLSCLRGEKYK